MIRLLSTLILVTLASQSVAAPKRLLCNQDINDGGATFTIEAILETDDFAKENPKAEVTLLSWKNDGKEVVSIGSRFTAATGKTYRTPYSVTPTTLSITARIITQETDYGGHLKKLDISRRDLTISDGRCTIEDYGANNAI